MFTAPAISATGCVSRASPGENPAGKDSPNTKYRSRSALLVERASKLVSGSRELTTGVEPATISCEARHLIHVAAVGQHLRKPQNDTQVIWSGYILMIERLLHEFPHPPAIRDVRRFRAGHSC
jgi:hypothetical protein